MNFSEIVSRVGRPIEGLGPWRHSEIHRARRIIGALASYERIENWSYITFDTWTRAQAVVLAKRLNDAFMFPHWKLCTKHRKGIILYYEPSLLSNRGPDQFEIPAINYHYPFKKCGLAGNWFKVRNQCVHATINAANRPDRIYRYALDPVHGHIIFRAL